MPVGPGVLLASERAAIAHRRVLASECARRSTAMRRADDDHRFPLHVTHISLPPAGETGANAGDRVAPPADSRSLSLTPSLPLSVFASLSLSLQCNPCHLRVGAASRNAHLLEDLVICALLLHNALFFFNF